MQPRIAIVALAVVVAGSLAASPVVVFFDDFEGGAQNEWSNGATTSAGGEFSEFLGDFSNQSTVLTLAGLPVHTSLTINFDLYIIDSWDGSGQSGGGSADFFSFSIDGNAILNETFSTFDLNHATYTASPGATAPAHFGSNLGFNSFADAIYLDLSNGFTVEHTASSVSILFTDLNSLQGKPDESWGLDNVTVSVVIPEPGAWMLTALGLAMIIGYRHRR